MLTAFLDREVILSNIKTDLSGGSLSIEITEKG